MSSFEVCTSCSCLSHSIAGADDVDPTADGLPFDSTPSTFDTQFFIETLLKGTGFPGSSGNQGEVESPLAGELRLQSDNNFARAEETACFWQLNIDDQDFMAITFAAAFFKLQNLGQNVNKMVDCSDVIPVPPRLPSKNAQSFIPPTLTQKDIQESCDILEFPTLSVLPGPVESVAQM